MAILTDIETQELLNKIIDSESLCNFVGLLLGTMEEKIDGKDFTEIDILFKGLYMNFKILSVGLVQIKEMIDK